MDIPQAVFNATNGADGLAQSKTTYHILSGSFRSLSLFLLAFSPLNCTLDLVKSTETAFGLHQYLNAVGDRVYTTSWAWPPILSCWELERFSGESESGEAKWRVEHVNNVPITATSSYIDIPPPYTHVYSTGGPAGEVHLIDKTTGFGEKVQEVLLVPEEELEGADKIRVALISSFLSC